MFFDRVERAMSNYPVILIAVTIVATCQPNFGFADVRERKPIARETKMPITASVSPDKTPSPGGPIPIPYPDTPTGKEATTN